jgi:thiol-disulfide isomerase/thioredoxin
MISLSDERFRNKVVVIQIMGSWCPNCLDETNFLVPFYDRLNEKGFEVIGLSFEKTGDFQKAISLVNRLKQRLHVKYPLLIAGDRQNISSALPMINRIMGYPTTLYIDRKGRVRKIHTGFSGPATGGEYDKFRDDFTAFIQKLLAEK